MELAPQTVLQLRLRANALRQDIIQMVATAQSGHPAGALGLAEVFTALYFHELRHRPKQPLWRERDRLLVSNGHTCPVWYAALAQAGYFPHEELQTFRKINSRLQGHPHAGALPGIENSSGPLGQGLSQAIGVAADLRLNKSDARVYCVLSDAEHDEGQTWEAVLYAGQQGMNNLVAIVDRNRIQIDGFTEDLAPLEPLAQKYVAFRWHVIEIQAHHLTEILTAFAEAKKVQDKPVVILAHSTAGKGVSFMENKPEWHGKPPSATQAEAALRELAEEARQLHAQEQ